MLRALPLALLALGACGLIDTDVTDVSLRLPSREVTVDTGTWGLPEAETLPSVDCSKDETLCTAGEPPLCDAEGCEASCSTDFTCQVDLPIALFNTFDLATESPELEALDGAGLVDVGIDRVWFEVTENTLDQASLPLDLAVAAQGVMTIEADAIIGTVPSVPAGMLIEEEDVDLTEDGKERLAEYFKNYQTPFNLIVGANLTLGAGDAIPTGRMVAVVHVDAHAGL
jgi:hypothetical protein